MSASNIETEAADLCCASCGIAEIDEIKLNKCDGGCDLAQYCSDECQQDHRQAHEAICKERAAVLRDEILFRQPESSHLGDCPICFLPLPLDSTQRVIQSCCSKRICDGCAFANQIQEAEQRLIHRCTFCRKPIPTTDKETKTNEMKRVAANDPVQLCEMGKKYYFEGDYDGAFKYFTRAAEMGGVEAHYNLSCMYREGNGVEKDKERERYHLEQAAISGHPSARYNLGVYEARKQRFDRAVKHWIIAANLGLDKSTQKLKECYKDGLISKDDFAMALRALQAALDAMKSPQREAAAKWYAMRAQANSST